MAEDSVSAGEPESNGTGPNADEVVINEQAGIGIGRPFEVDARTAKALELMTPPDRVRPWGTRTPSKPYPIQLDRERHIRIPVTIMLAFETKYDMDLRKVATWRAMDDSLSMMLDLLHMCLKLEDPELTYEQMLELEGMDLSNMGYVGECLWESWNSAWPELKLDDQEGAAGEGEDPNRQSRSTGSNGGRSAGSPSGSGGTNSARTPPRRS